MTSTKIVKKLKRWLFLARLWFWAATHSSEFQECQLLLYRFPIAVAVNRPTWGSTLLSISIEFNRLEWNLFIPSDTYNAFLQIDEMQNTSEIVSFEDVSDIPF